MKKIKAVGFKDHNFEEEYKKISLLSDKQLFEHFSTNIMGLSSEKALYKLKNNGKNVINNQKKKRWFNFLIKALLDPFIIVLIVLAIATYVFGSGSADYIGSIIISFIALFSTILRFTQEYSSHLSSEKLKYLIKTKVNVRRNSYTPKEVDLEDLVIGDIIELAAGSMIPTDVIIIESHDLFVAQSIFNGESNPVEKYDHNDEGKQIDNITEIPNLCLMGTTVISGSALALAINTGNGNYLGLVASSIKEEKVETNFDKGVKSVSYTLIKYMVIIVLAVFFINGLIKGNWLEALLFAISVAVGLTPGMLPMIVNANLAKGAAFLAKKKTIVKNIDAIQNLGAIDILCTDKTGTLTEDRIVLQKYININGEEDLSVLKYAYSNSYFGTGVKNIIDKAIIDYGKIHHDEKYIKGYKKIDEIPFDYERKRMSVIISNEKEEHLLITKGALESIFEICDFVLDGDKKKAITEKIKNKIMSEADEFHKKCMHVIAVAIKEERFDIKSFAKQDENKMIFVGFVAFLDPLKKDVKDTLNELKNIGVSIKILTGDSLEVTKTICEQVGMDTSTYLIGHDIEKMDDKALREASQNNSIFARLSPMQKNRIIEALKANGHVVGYMGDGVNDAPSLRSADVGISVNTATEIARESSDIVLLSKDLMILRNGILEGRKIFGNIIKYMKMALSSNFGNMFSVLVGSIFLPFLPMIPIQILVQNMLYDFSQTAIPWDDVDKDFLVKPKQWDIRDLERYMKTIGVVSSIYDVVTYLTLWFILGYNTIHMQAYFQTGWFLEGLISQTIIVYFIRTAKIPFVESKPNRALVVTTLLAVAIALIIPFLPFASSLNFVVPNMRFYLFLPIILILYFVSVQLVKKWYIKKYNTWL